MKKIKSVRYAVARWNVSEKNTSAGNSFLLPAKCEVYEYYTESYGCPDCKEGKGDTEKSVIVKSKVPPALIGKGPASSSTVAWTIYQKYANRHALSIVRKRTGKSMVPLSAGQPLRTGSSTVLGHYFRPLYGYFHRQLLLREFLMADETRVQVLKEPGRSAESQSFMWLYRTRGRWSSGHPAVWIYPDEERRQCSRLSGRLSGISETDGYQGYNKVSGIKRCSCWAHIRRYFCGCDPERKAAGLQPAGSTGSALLRPPGKTGKQHFR